MSANLPQFLGIGVQKGGTTSLYSLLKKHPNIYLPTKKEIHFFTLNFYKGNEWYENHFDACSSKQICGEVTPYYIFHPYALQRIKQLCPEVKLIILLRDPVQRALSHYFHSKRLGLETNNLYDAILLEKERLMGAESLLIAPSGRHHSHQEHSYISRSRYEIQLECIYKLFSSQKVFLRKSEDLFNKESFFWEEILDFLDVEHMSIPLKGNNLNKGTYHEFDNELVKGIDLIRSELAKTYRILENKYNMVW